MAFKPRKFGGPKKSFGHKEGFVRREPGHKSGGLELFDARCAKCGKDTQVPFRPTQGKPVLCRDCFKSGDSGSRSTPRNDDLAAIHEKLDKIMRALDID